MLASRNSTELSKTQMFLASRNSTELSKTQMFLASRNSTELSKTQMFLASRNSTELSKYVWSLKDNNINHVITWQIIARAKPYNSASKRCNLCLLEKFIIIREPHRCTLNKRNELVSGCRHRKKSLQRSNCIYT